MKSILITGDIHGELERFSKRNFLEYYYKDLKNSDKKDNVIIVCGDFGFIWAREEDKEEKYELDILQDKPFTILFVDGNHENHYRLNHDFLTTNLYGGKVHKIRDNVYHLMRGEVYTILGKKFFTFGGASSHDITDGILDYEDENWKKKANNLYKQGKYRYRVKGLSWWEEEMPSDEEMEHGLENLKLHDNKVNYIITHQPPEMIMRQLSDNPLDFNAFTSYLQKINDTVDFNTWFAGHMHIDRKIDDKHQQMYYKIYTLYEEL